MTVKKRLLIWISSAPTCNLPNDLSQWLPNWDMEIAPPTEALAAVMEWQADALVVDLPTVDSALTLCRRIRHRAGRRMPVLFLIADPADITTEHRNSIHALTHGICPRPIQPAFLAVSLDQAVEFSDPSEKHYRTVFENTATAIVIMEADTTISMVNREFERLSGIPREAIEGRMKWTWFVHPDDLARMRDYHFRRRRRGSAPPSVYEFRFVTATGEEKDILIRVGLIEGTARSVGSLLDISPRKKAEEALRASEEKYRNIVESIDEGYFELDLAGNFRFVNGPLCRIVGVPRDLLLGMNYRTYSSEQSRGDMEHVFHHIFQTGNPVRMSRFEIETPERRMVVELTASRILDEQGEPEGFRGLLRDVTDRIVAEEKQRRYERLQGVMETAGAVCHELNQPLQSLLGYAELLQMDLLEAHPQGRRVEKIVAQVARIKELTEKLMRITRYETVEYLNGNTIIDIDRACQGPFVVGRAKERLG